MTILICSGFPCALHLRSYILWKGWPLNFHGDVFVVAALAQRFPDLESEVSSTPQLGGRGASQRWTQGHPGPKVIDGWISGTIAMAAIAPSSLWNSWVLELSFLGRWSLASESPHALNKAVSTSFSSGSMNYPRTCSALSMFRFGWHNVFQRCWPRPIEMIIDFDLTRCSLPLFELSSDYGVPHTIDATMLS